MEGVGKTGRPWARGKDNASLGFAGLDVEWGREGSGMTANAKMGAMQEMTLKTYKNKSR